MPVHTYTNWNQRPSDQEEQIEPFRKYFFICERALFGGNNSVKQRFFLI